MVDVTPVVVAKRVVFRGREAARTAASEAFGAPLPSVPCRATTLGDRAALWQGPDEWLLLNPPDAMADALASVPHALVDISHRQSALAVSGTDAATALNTGCPLNLDLAEFPVGMCTRTVLAKSAITLWRTGEDRFHLEVWRSFLPYVRDYLHEAARELSS